MSSIPSGYRKIIDPLIATARDILERGEPLHPMAFVGNLGTGEIKIVPIDTGSAQAKDDAEHLLRHLAALLQADFVFNVMDSWGLPPDKMPRVHEIMARYGSIGASPYCVDVVALMLETRYGLWAAQMPVKPKGVSKKKRTFGEPKFRHFTEVRGRFAHLLPEKPETDSTSTSLH